MKRVRCAVYTRKSTEDGLEQDFNSLDAQREACEAFIASQKHEGWRALPDRYDDGGFSGGTVERPALQQLLADIQARKIDAVVVYKVDRLSRSLADFVRLVERFDATNVSFVSVTQQFNTASSMGRLTLNVLLSFAQFEREVTAERIRDKIAASRKKGLWTGGLAPLGYDTLNKRLVVNEPEADVVRSIFRLYLELGCVRELAHEAARRGYMTKRRISKDGTHTGGVRFMRGALYHLLRNPIYIGQVTHKGATYPGVHEPIIDQAIWDAVQSELERKRRRHADREGARWPSLLVGKVEDDLGRPLTPSHATKAGRRYRYYISRPELHVDEPWRFPAAALENAVADLLASRLSDASSLSRSLERYAPRSAIGRLTGRASEVSAALRNGEATERRALFDRILLKVTIAETGLTVEIVPGALLEELGVEALVDEPPIRWTAPMRTARRGVEAKFVLPSSTRPTNVDEALVRAVASGHVWFEELARGDAPSLKAIAERDGIDAGNLTRHIGLAFLAPDIVQAILDGRQPPHLTAERLMRGGDLPLDWGEQRRVLGFEFPTPQHQ